LGQGTSHDGSPLEIDNKRKRRHTVYWLEKLGKKEKDKHERKEGEALISGREGVLLESSRVDYQTITKNLQL